MNWLANNIGTILVTFALIAIIFAIFRKLINDRKQGKSSCGCNCEHCAMGEHCYENTDSSKEQKGVGNREK